MSLRRRSNVVLVLSVCFIGAGCATRVTPPARVRQPVRVFIADYGPHAGLILPDGDQGLVEFAFGEWDWFALNHDHWYNAIPLIFFPGQGTLGTRRLQRTSDLHELTALLGGVEVQPIVVEQLSAQRLLEQLRSEYETGKSKELFNPQVGLWFVPVGTRYRSTHNCNHAVAGWLEALGCRVRGPRGMADFRIEPAVGGQVPRARASRRPDKGWDGLTAAKSDRP